MSSNTPNDFSPTPAPTSLSVSVAAPAEVGQVVGTSSFSNVAALFVRRKSHYQSLGADCYDIDRDALTWRGGQPGVFHPPCRAWGQLSHFAKPRSGERELALWAVEKCREFGGVVEHPINSRLWAEVGCLGYGIRDQHGGVLVPVLQSWWGHRAPKKTGLYIVGLTTSLSLPPPIDRSSTTIERMCRAERERTPFELALWLVNLAASCVGKLEQCA